jgi:SAM-dependent methyltransferase
MPDRSNKQAYEDESLYRQRAELYDLIYHWKDYATEAARLRHLLLAEGIADGSRVLEAACGTGSYLSHLGAWYRATGFDLNDEMLAVARSKLSAQVKLFRSDMADFTVDEPFDAILCLFSSIGYVYPEERLRDTAACFAKAVRPGGVAVIEPWIAPENYQPGYGSIFTYESPDTKLCRASIGRRDGELAVLDFHWLIVRTGAEAVEHCIDRHRLWLCPSDRMQGIFNAAGFDCRLQPDGIMPKRGLLVARKRP